MLKNSSSSLSKRNASFDAWMASINSEISRRYGLSSDDLPDCPYSDWYENGMNSKSAVRVAIRNAS